MLRELSSIALLTPALLSVEGLSFADQSQALNLPQLDSSLKDLVCQNNWNRAIKAMGPRIGNPQITSQDRQQLIEFRHQLQDWQAAGAKVSELPGCEGVAVSVDGPTIEYSASTSLDFEAGLESVVAMRSLPQGYIGYAGLSQAADSVDRSCRVIDARGKRIDLSVLCDGQ
ncbi:hypothetical protein [Trichocoleus sp. FACHB-262]|uniref:hypothetical protein n=1 Tax=Trichocoleus sp. FACHB-262 TaxID=2692869 RepID=UPI0016875C31|nr:hypothetical protein [Trichocoleus sp. FACHB-262]MBD2121282.1 hypothetical protein [Trichocoleus sp. FACHB-262]